MNTKLIRISVGAYKRLLELKKEEGISITKLVDEMVVSYAAGTHFDKLSDVVKLASSKEGFIEALNEVMKEFDKKKGG